MITRLFHLRGSIGLVVLAGLMLGGCSRAYYRQQADQDAARLVVNASKGTRDPWTEFSIQVPPESRMFDGSSPDHPPMPPDDPVAHQLMHCVDCKEGNPCWHAYGDTFVLQNPHWLDYLPWTDEGDVRVDLETAVQLGLFHSTDFQESLEDLYLSALDVSAERFNFDVLYFGGNDTFITAAGRDQGGGVSSSALNTNTAFGYNKAFSAGGQLLVGFANNFVWQFAGSDTETTNSLLNFSLVQPLLRGGGRARVMETLTISERALLANVRAMERFRRGFFVEIITGSGGVAGPNRRGGFFGGSGLSGFTGVGGGGFGGVGGGGGGFAGGAGAASAGGFMGIIQDQRELRNQEANVASLVDSVELLEAFQNANRIDRLQVDLARQALYNAQSQLLTGKAAYQSTLDGFKLDLGLPPELPIRVEDDTLDQFELLSPELIALQTAGTDVLSRMWSGPKDVQPDPDVEATRDQLMSNVRLLDSTKDLLELYRFRPGVQPQDAGVVARFQNMLDELILVHQRMIYLLDPLRYYGPVMDDARALQQRSMDSLVTVRGAVDELEASAARRIEILEQLSASDPVASGEVDPTAFNVDVFQDRRNRLNTAFGLINQRLSTPQEAWEGRRLRIEGLEAPSQAAQERVVALMEPLQPLVEQLEAARTAVREAALENRDQANQALFAALEDLIPQLNGMQQDMVTTRVAVEGFLVQAESTLDEALQAVRRMADDASEMGLIQARARLETVYLPPQELTEERALAIACEYRRDWMNARMGLVDSWRLIEFNADDLESDLDITFSGDLGTNSDNPFRFRDSNGSLSAGLAFDAPLQRLVERNVYRQALIEYQQARRNYVQFVDGVRASLRNILRTQELNVLNFELRRRSVHVAIDQVELTRLRLYEPPRPGETAEFGATTARDLVSALTDLLSVQNDFLSVWVNYEVQRMVTDLSLGTMELDDRGLWLDPGDNLGDVPLACDVAEVQDLPGDVHDLQHMFGNPSEFIPPGLEPGTDPPAGPLLPPPGGDGDGARPIGLQTVDNSQFFDDTAAAEAGGAPDSKAPKSPPPRLFRYLPEREKTDVKDSAGAEPLRLQLPNLTAKDKSADDKAAEQRAADNQAQGSNLRQTAHTVAEDSTTAKRAGGPDELNQADEEEHVQASSNGESTQQETKKTESKTNDGKPKKQGDPLFGNR